MINIKNSKKQKKGETENFQQMINNQKREKRNESGKNAQFIT